MNGVNGYIKSQRTAGPYRPGHLESLVGHTHPFHPLESFLESDNGRPSLIRRVENFALGTQGSSAGSNGDITYQSFEDFLRNHMKSMGFKETDKHPNDPWNMRFTYNEGRELVFCIGNLPSEGKIEVVAFEVDESRVTQKQPLQ